jgi:uncharacterized integral membrane protein (TIGR00697 family)
MFLTNEIIFLSSATLITLSILGVLRLGKEALVSLVSLMAVLANLLVSKQILLVGLNATATDSLALGVTLSLNILQEFYGRSTTLRAIWISFAGLLFYTIISQLHIAYIPSPFDICHPSYYLILHNMPRIAVVSLLVYLIVQNLDCMLYGFLKKYYSGKHFIVRNLISLSCTQLIDTVLFTFLALYGIVSHIGNIIAFSYSIKIITLLLSIPFLALARKFYKS